MRSELVQLGGGWRAMFTLPDDVSLYADRPIWGAVEFYKGARSVKFARVPQAVWKGQGVLF